MKRPLIKSLILAIALMCFAFLGINWSMHSITNSYIYQQTSQVPTKYTGLLLGAYVYPDGHLSDMLRDRADMAIDLYRSGKIKRILVSGDHGTKEYDEVNHIRLYLLSHNIPAQDIFLDHAGFDTYDSLYRAKEIFQVDSLIIITQEFHLPRAVYLARSLGLDAVGIKADKYDYAGVAINYLREYPADLKAFADALLHVSPRFGGPQIPITGESKLSWDTLN